MQLPLPLRGNKGLCNWPSNVLIHGKSVSEQAKALYKKFDTKRKSAPHSVKDHKKTNLELSAQRSVKDYTKTNLELSSVRDITNLTLTSFLQNNISISKKKLLLTRIKNKSDLIIDLNFLVQLPLPFCGKKGLCNWPKNVLIHGKPVCEQAKAFYSKRRRESEKIRSEKRRKLEGFEQTKKRKDSDKIRSENRRKLKSFEQTKKRRDSEKIRSENRRILESTEETHKRRETARIRAQKKRKFDSPGEMLKLAITEYWKNPDQMLHEQE